MGTPAALAWLIAQRDSSGTWYSTQATVLALKALLAGTGKSLANGRPQQVEIRCEGRLVRDVLIPASQSDIVQQIDLSPLVAKGDHHLTLVDRNGTSPVYQVSLRYHLPEARKPPDEGPLAIELTYDKTELAVNDSVEVVAKVVNRTSDELPMVLLDLPIPAGFAIEGEDLESLVTAKTIAKYQRTPRSVVVYLRQLSPAEPLVLRYRLRATMPVKIAVPPARAYEYYNPDKQATGRVIRLTVAGEK